MPEVPWSEEAEESVLGWLLSPWPYDEKLRVLDRLDSDAFYKPEHRGIYDAVSTLLGRRALVDETTVAAELDSCAGPRPDGEGWRSRLLGIAASAGIHGGEYARVVEELAVLRRGIALGDRLRDLAYGRDLDALLAAIEGSEEELRPPLPDVAALDASELVALANQDDLVPQKPWVLPGLLRTNEKLVVTGGEGVGKMTLARQFAVTVAAGIHPLLCLPVGDDPLPTLVIDLQEDRIDSALSLRPLIKRAGDALDPSMFHAEHLPAGINLLARRDLSRVEALIARYRPKLVVIGPLVRMFRADAKRSRHSEDLVDEVTDALDQLMVRYEFALVVEGHAGNDRGSEEAWRPRGSSVWRSWPSVGIGLEGVSFAPREAKVHQWRWSRYADRAWPSRLVGGAGWPWTLDGGDYEKLARKLGLDWLIDGAETELVF